MDSFGDENLCTLCSELFSIYMNPRNVNLFISKAIPIFIFPYCMLGKFLIGISVCLYNRDCESKISLKFKLNKVQLEGLNLRKFNFQHAN